MRIIRIPVEREKAEYLERLNYESNSMKDIVQRLIETHPNDASLIKGETFRTYQKQCAELCAEYNLAAAEIERQYIPEILREHKCSWNIPPNSAEMVVNILCGCEIDLTGYEVVEK